MGNVKINSRPAKRFQPHNLKARTDFTNNLGGKFALPAEFDSEQYAAGWYREGQEANSMMQDQPVQGTAYTSEGWRVWMFPKEMPDPSGGLEVDESPKMVKHHSADQPHKVAGSGKDDGTYVLMYRSADVQDDVNRIYGQQSIDQMVQEVHGETVGGQAQTDSGMLTERILQRHIGIDQEVEALDGHSSAVHGGIPSVAQKITKKSRKVSR